MQTILRLFVNTDLTPATYKGPSTLSLWHKRCVSELRGSNVETQACMDVNPMQPGLASDPHRRFAPKA